MPICLNIGPNSRRTLSWNPENTSGVSIGTISGVCSAEAGCTRCDRLRQQLAGHFDAVPRLRFCQEIWSRTAGSRRKSLISSISSIGVMPQIASGENTLIRSATAPINFPST